MCVHWIVEGQLAVLQADVVAQLVECRPCQLYFCQFTLLANLSLLLHHNLFNVMPLLQEDGLELLFPELNCLEL